MTMRITITNDDPIRTARVSVLVEEEPAKVG